MSIVAVQPPAVNTRPRLMQIEGLRAVAAILVAVFHIWLGRVSGGVDVFFVVSGFLITLSLLGHFDRSGRIRPATYLGRLVRRLFPPALLVLAVSVAGTFAFLPLNGQLQTFQEVVASALYYENWQLAYSAVDYLAADSFHTPVQHFWAMSTQGQFYVIWLAIFLAVGLATQARRRVATIAIAAIVALSFAYSIVATNVDQPFAYYDAFARVWEFGVGALVALLGTRLRIPDSLRALFSWLGIIGVVACGFVLQASTMFPGVAALWPVASSVLVLLGGSLGAGRLLSTPLMVWLGSLSYGIYLWHWPVLIFFVQRSRGEEPNIVEGTAIILLSVALAWATKVFFESPLKRLTAQKLLTAILLAAMVVAGVGFTSARAVDHRIQESIAEAQQLASGAIPCLGAAAMADPSGCADADFDSTIPSDPRSDIPAAFGSECSTGPNDTEVKECSYGDLDSEKRIVLIGNSHAINWFPALEQYAVQEGWRLDMFFKNACAFNVTLRQTDDPRRGSSCLDWVDAVSERLAERPPYDLAFTSYSVGGAELGDSPEDGIQGFVEALTPIGERGTKLVLMADTPRLPTTVYECYMQRLDDVASCGELAPEDVSPGRDLLVESAERIPNAAVVDLNWLHCNETCPMQVGGVNIYRDPSHLTTTWTLSATPYLVAELDRIARQP